MSQYTRACHMPCQWLNCPVATHSRRHCERAESRTRIDELPEHCPSPSAFRTHATWRLRCGRCHTHSKRKRSMCGGESAHHEHELPRPTRHRRVAASADTVGGGRQVVNMWLAATDLRCIPASALPCCLQQPTPPHPSPPPSPPPLCISQQRSYAERVPRLVGWGLRSLHPRKIHRQIDQVHPRLLGCREVGPRVVGRIRLRGPRCPLRSGVRLLLRGAH